MRAPLGLLLLVACEGAAPEARAPAPQARAAAPDARPSFLVIAPDTLRADRLDATRAGRPVMPNAQELATRGSTFTQAYSQSGWTLPALAALLSGRYPLAARNVEGQALGFLRGDIPTLPERLLAAGYTTAVFWGRGISEAAPEFSRGFAHIDRDAAADHTSDVLDWIRATEGPYFALVHNVDLQFPTAPVPGDALLADVHPSAEQGMEPVYTALAAQAGPEAAGASLHAAYDAVVTRYDAAIGRLVDGLAAAGRDDDTVVILVSNHGLELGEHGNYWHGAIYDTNLHIPLVLAAPNAEARRIDTLVQTIDVAPTVLQQVGLSPGPEVTGQSLVPLLGGAGAYEARPIYAFNTANLLAARSATHKVARIVEPSGAVKIQAFDLTVDPGEQRELGALPDEAQRLRQGLDAWWATRQEETAGAGTAAGGEALKQALRDNGYWGQATGTSAGTGGKPVDTPARTATPTPSHTATPGGAGRPGPVPPPPER